MGNEGLDGVKIDLTGEAGSTYNSSSQGVAEKDRKELVYPDGKPHALPEINRDNLS